LIRLIYDKRDRTMAINSEHIILNVKSEVPFMNLLEKQSGEGIKETGDGPYHVGKVGG